LFRQGLKGDYTWKGGGKMDCIVCGKEIDSEENCYQVTYGYLTEEDDFVPQEEFGCAHEGCLPLTPTM